jgi:hypothetical protein
VHLDVLSGWRTRHWAWLTSSLWLMGAAMAHDPFELPVPEEPGVQLAAQLAISQAEGDRAWPRAHLPGVLGVGTVPTDRRGTALEHGTVSAGIRGHGGWRGAVAAGWHDTDPPHLEMAWVERVWTVQHDDTLELGLGRKAVPAGRVWTGAGHFDWFASMPLAKRAAFDGDWIDDGVNLRWVRDSATGWPWLRQVDLDLGLWRGRVMPGGEGATPAPVLHVQAAWTGMTVDAFVTSVRPAPRGGHVLSATAGHTHSQPRCDGSLQGVFCFDGRSDVLGGSVSAPLPGIWHHWRLEGAAVLRRERGQLYSLNGDTDYTGTTAGQWLDLRWQPNATWSVAARMEQLRAVQRITGRSAQVVATDAGLNGSTRLQRQALAVGWQSPDAQWQLRLELGQDVTGNRRDVFQALRLIWTPPAWIHSF